jgi:2-polyprenyl-6-methoxyphenol hydroxylase-like FAD-dependent oxidoreductase
VDDYDAIVVGARCAGSVLAARLAGAGWRVLLLDRVTFPSDTVSTHFLFPNTLERLAALGVMAFPFAYWTGFPAAEWFRMDVREDLSLLSCPCEDGIHLLVLAGPPSLARGDRTAGYLAGIRRFPATLNPLMVDRATMVSPVVTAPEPMMRGFFRQACGPGWALVGDSGHFKHPVTAQGISDAVEQAWFVTDALLGGDPALRSYPAWRDARAAGHYEWSFQSAHLSRPDHAHPVFAGPAADPEAGQEWRDLFTRLRSPSEVFTAERQARWAADWQDRPSTRAGVSRG